MRRALLSTLMLVLLAATVVACGGEASVPTTIAPTATIGAGGAGQVDAITPQSRAGEDAHIAVQHILIGFKDAVGFQGKPPAKAATRTQAEAKKLADDVLAKVKAGEDFDKLVVEFTDDSPPGIYRLANDGAAPGSGDEYPRSGMVAAFGDVGFKLKVSEVGLAEYDPVKSPFGFHIIKRIVPPPPPPSPTPETKPVGEDDRITVQHILIGFKDAVGFGGNVPPKAATRTQAEAKKLADDLLVRVKAGEDFDKLVKENTDDAPPGIYEMANKGVTPGSSTEYPRSGMVPAFGDVGFKLKVGEIGLAEYDSQKSPFGFHIIKRIK